MHTATKIPSAAIIIILYTDFFIMRPLYHQNRVKAYPMNRICLHISPIIYSFYFSSFLDNTYVTIAPMIVTAVNI